MLRTVIVVRGDAVDLFLAKARTQSLQQVANRIPGVLGGFKQGLIAVWALNHLGRREQQRFDRRLECQSLQALAQYTLEAAPIGREIGEAQHDIRHCVTMPELQHDLAHAGLPRRQPAGQGGNQTSSRE